MFSAFFNVNMKTYQKHARRISMKRKRHVVEESLKKLQSKEIKDAALFTMKPKPKIDLNAILD
jgi:hypothetical protein